MNETELAKKMLNEKERLTLLYSIVDKNGKKRPFKMNYAQNYLYDNMHNCMLILKARQLGISTFMSIYLLDKCLFKPNVSAGIIAHTKEDSEVLFRRVKFAYDNLPEDIKKKRSAEMENVKELIFNNGSSIRVATSMRSSTVQYLHISEFGKICAKYPDKALEIITGSLNSVALGQFVIIESTSEGREGYFYEMVKAAMAAEQRKQKVGKLDYKLIFFPWWKHSDYTLEEEQKVIQEDQEYFNKIEECDKISLTTSQKNWYIAKKRSQGDAMFREYPTTVDECFFVSNEMLIYGKWMTKARQEGRITKVVYDESVPVCTAWDLGYGDFTSVWFFQVVRQEIHLIEYYENNLENLEHYLTYVKNKNYSYTTHFVPHDAGAHELQTGLTAQEKAQKHGVNFTILPKHEIANGIDQARIILGRCWFDEEKCSAGLRALDNYKYSWDEKLGTIRPKPLHNFASHGADAFRYLAIGIEKYGVNSGNGLTPDKINEMRIRNYGY